VRVYPPYDWATVDLTDPDMVRTGRPPSLPQWPVPRDTRLDATATAAALDVELPDLDTQPAQLRREMEGATCRTT
jgi:hypothetical protein